MMGWRLVAAIALGVMCLVIPACSGGGGGGCDADQMRCVGNDVQRCKGDGSDWEFYRTCESGTQCVNGGCTNLVDCGNGSCGADENCSACPGDCPCPGGQTCDNGECGSGPGDCGNGSCGAGENCGNCVEDCACSADQECVSNACQATATCGNDACDGTENCRNCAADCGACEASFKCGGATCDQATCAADGATCSFVDCQQRSWGPPLYFADDMAAAAGCQGHQLPAFVAAKHCFVTQDDWQMVVDTCTTWYMYCACTDGFWEWTAMWMSGNPMYDSPDDPGPECGAAPGGCGCTPQCTDRECGPDGCGGMCGWCNTGESCNAGTCGSGGGDACNQCLEGCRGEDLCCIGLGCWCHDQCMGGSCGEGTELCCGPYDCMCMPPAQCPYP
jgi:hypothetical protein